jgi:hypothetical protein
MPLYAPGVTPSAAVERTLARWYAHYVRAVGHEPPVELARKARLRIEAIAARRDARRAK